MATTADVLARKLEETHSEIVQVRCEVVEALRAFYSNTSGISIDDAIAVAAKWTPKRHRSYNPQLVDNAANSPPAEPRSDLQNKIARLNDALVSTVAQLQPNGAAPHAQLVHSFTQRERLKRQMAQSNEMIALIEQLTAIDALLRAADTFLVDAQLVQAAQALRDAQHQLQLLTSSGGDTATTSDTTTNKSIHRVMALQMLKQQQQLTQQLKQLYATAIVWTRTTLRVTNTLLPTTTDGSDASSSSPSSTTQLEMFWRASAIDGTLSTRLKDVAKALALHVLTPVLQAPHATIHVTRNDVDSSSSSAVLTLVCETKTVTKPMRDVAQVEATCANVVSVLYFVFTDVLQRDKALMAQLGALLWTLPGHLEAQLVHLLQDKIPHDAAALAAYREALTIGVQELEDKLFAIGMTACANNQLRIVVQQLHELYAKKRRQTILSRGRDAMSTSGYNDSVRVTGATERCNLDASSSGAAKKKKSSAKAKGAAAAATAASSSIASDTDDVESGAFHVPDYRISVCARDVVELAHATLLEACSNVSEPACARLLFQTSRDLLLLFRTVVATLNERDIAHDARASMLFHNDCLYAATHMLTIGHLYKHRLPAPLDRTATMIDMVPAFRDAGERALTMFAKAQSDDFAAEMVHLPSFGDVDAPSALQRIEDVVQRALYKLQRISASWREGLPASVYRHVMGLVVAPLTRGFVDRIVAVTKLSATAAAQLHHMSLLVLEVESLFDSPGQAAKHVPSLTKLHILASLLTEPLEAVRDQFDAGNLAALSTHELAQVVRSLHRDSPEKRAFLQVLQQ